MNDTWSVYGVELNSRLILGTARYPSPTLMAESIAAANVDVVTVSLRRQAPNQSKINAIWQHIQNTGCRVLPNTAGCHTAKEAQTIAQMSREIFSTHWIKLEVIGDDYNLQPDPYELLKATSLLAKDGFKIFAYTTDDLVIANRLRDAGCQVIMPWGAPIGTGKGLLNRNALETLRMRLPDHTLIIDAGIGLPSHAASAMELGFDGVLLNTAVSTSDDPVLMASAMKHAVIAGRTAYQAGAMAEVDTAHPSTPVVGTPFWHANSNGSE